MNSFYKSGFDWLGNVIPAITIMKYAVRLTGPTLHMIDFYFFSLFFLSPVNCWILDFFYFKNICIFLISFPDHLSSRSILPHSILSVTSSTKISCLFTYFIYPSCPCTEFYKKHKGKAYINVLLLLSSAIILLSLLLLLLLKK